MLAVTVTPFSFRIYLLIYMSKENQYELIQRCVRWKYLKNKLIIETLWLCMSRNFVTRPEQHVHLSANIFFIAHIHSSVHISSYSLWIRTLSLFLGKGTLFSHFPETKVSEGMKFALVVHTRLRYTSWLMYIPLLPIGPGNVCPTWLSLFITILSFHWNSYFLVRED